ncbi:MAG: hypothetical protein KBC30_05300 [Planctomycetes bacterium]|nr:hypothetical protein [Planctomycetota bacterium]HPY74382.1 hypothetical protein [Planctomycetota bacterium]HQA99958.1 hypothetical protein [Planctomycetota bacterium]HRU50873.1 hypothetical protein [Planctomycetota bacterium]
MKVKLSKALKIKNNLINQYNQATDIFSRENSRLVKSTSTIDREKIYQKIEKLLNLIIEVKTRIAEANIGIYKQIASIAEVKSIISYLRSLNTTDGIITKTTYQSTYEEEYTAYLKVADIDAKILELTKKIELLQDEVDEYNATHEIILPDDELIYNK